MMKTKYRKEKAFRIQQKFNMRAKYSDVTYRAAW